MKKKAGSNMGEKILWGRTLVKIVTPGKNWLTGGGLFFLKKAQYSRGKINEPMVPARKGDGEWQNPTQEKAPRILRWVTNRHHTTSSACSIVIFRAWALCMARAWVVM